MNAQTERTITICHISDFHLPLTQRVPLTRFAGKRILGYANLVFNRGNTHKRQAFTALLDAVKRERPDITVISGDTVNLALDFEFAEVADVLRSMGFTRENLLMVPGNHDRYTPGAAMRHSFEKFFAEFMPESQDGAYPFPVSKQVGPTAIIGLDTATWRGPLRAAGKLRPAQVSKMRVLLDGPMKELYPVIVMHHPPFAIEGFGFKQYRDGMARGDQLIRALEGRNAIILHGHIHRESHRTMGDVQVYGVASASNDFGHANKQLAFHVYRFDKSGLTDATSVRHWPLNAPGADFQRVKL